MATMVERAGAPLSSERRFYFGMAIAILANRGWPSPAG
jgi:hypothetical protein